MLFQTYQIKIEVTSLKYLEYLKMMFELTFDVFKSN